MSFFSQLMLGALASLRGLAIIMSNAPIRRLALLPFILTLVVFLGGLSWGLPFVTGLVGPATASILKFLSIKPSSALFDALTWVIPVLLWPPLVLFLLYLLWLVTRLLASPFYSLLSERVLMESGAIEDGRFHLLRWAHVSLRMAVVSVVRTLVLAVIGLILFVLSFIPGLGILTSLCFMSIVTSDICDYAFEAMQWKLKQRIEFLRRNIGFVLGFSSMLAVVFLIPGLNFFLLPASVVGATDVVRRLAGAGMSTERISS